MGNALGVWAELCLQAVAAAGDAVARLGEPAGRRVVAAHVETYRADGPETIAVDEATGRRVVEAHAEVYRAGDP